MNWYYAESGQQRGPITDEELRERVAQGVIRPETLVWNESLPNWQPWSAVAPPGSVAIAPGLVAAPADGKLRCSRCQQWFLPEELLELSGRRVCGACKPLLLQQLREGVAVPGGAGVALEEVPGTLSEEEFLARDYSLDAVSALSEGWALMFRRSAVVWLGCLIVWAAFVGASIGFSALQFIPIIGLIASSLLNGLAAALVEAGNGILFVRERRGMPNEVTHGFSFIGPRFWDILLTHLPHLAFTFLMVLGILVLGAGTAVTTFGAFRGGPGFNPGFQMPETPVLIVLGMGAAVLGMAYLYVYTHLRFAPLLALDKGYRWNVALRLSWHFVHRHFWQNFWLLFLGGLVMMAGACVCLIGAVVSYPLGFGMVGVAYDRHFRDLAPAVR